MEAEPKPLSIRLFGPLEVRVDGVAVADLRLHPKSARLLALLALHDSTPLSNEWVATQLWPDTGRVDSLRHEVAQLRPALGVAADRLTARAGSLCLDLTGVGLDVSQLERAWSNRKQDPAALAEAVDLYQGPLLQDWYDAWVPEYRSRYEELFQQALEWLVKAFLAAGRPALAHRYLRRLTSSGQPTEALHYQLMEMLVQRQEHLEAKQLFEEYRDFLKQEHRLTPSPRMSALSERIPRIATEIVPKLEPARLELETVGGAMPLNSRFYIRRPVDQDFHAAIARRDSIILLRGPRQVGKTSLLARGLEQARQSGAQTLVTDFQKLSQEDTEHLDTFLVALARLIHRRLKVETAPDDCRDRKLSPNANFETYLRDHVLESSGLPLVWGIDEADSIFDRSYRTSVFGLFRSWHNERSLDPEGPWRRLTLILTYSTEARLFIPNLNQSPFNVGTRLALDDFTPEQVAQLNELYGSPLSRGEDLQRLYDLVGGHPYLVRRCLHEMRIGGLDIGALEALALRDDCLFSEHLQRLREGVSHDPEMLAELRGFLQGRGALSRETFSRLRSAGIVMGDADGQERIRCRLYADFLRSCLE